MIICQAVILQTSCVLHIELSLGMLWGICYV